MGTFFACCATNLVYRLLWTLYVIYICNFATLVTIASGLRYSLETIQPVALQHSVRTEMSVTLKSTTQIGPHQWGSFGVDSCLYLKSHIALHAHSTRIHVFYLSVPWTHSPSSPPQA